MNETELLNLQIRVQRILEMDDVTGELTTRIIEMLCDKYEELEASDKE